MTGIDMQVTGIDIRVLERASIRAFVESCGQLLAGRTLDLGCGLQPYRDLVTGEYVAFDRVRFPANVSREDVGDEIGAGDTGLFDAVLSTQVIQYATLPRTWLGKIHQLLKPGGHLVLTGPTCWPIVEEEDLWRFTPAGIRTLVEDAYFEVERLEQRAHVPVGGERFLLGWGLVGRAL